MSEHEKTLCELYIPTHDEQARQAFVGALKFQVNGPVEDDLAELYETRLRPAFEAENGRLPRNREEIIPAFQSEALYQTWGSLLYTSQDLMWETVGDMVDRIRPVFEARGRDIFGSEKRLGTMELNPKLTLPKPIADVEIHRQPGGYFFESAREDLTTGILYMGAIELYRTAKGLGADIRPGEPGRGRRIVKYIDEHFPDLKPRRILDLGCAIGTETTAYKERWPEAEVHGIDLSGPFVRFAHIWAEDQGLPMHFSQQNAAHTSFEDCSFDLIVSHILFHETWFDVQQDVMREVYRLLDLGGCFVNIDVPYQPGALSMTKQVTNDWQVEHNGEPYWTGFAERDVRNDMAAVGFDYDATFAEYEPIGRAVGYFFGAGKPA